MDGESSRQKAAQVREQLLLELDHSKILTIDLENASLTPSVADELIGGIATYIGSERFKNQIKLINVSESQRALMKHVIARRMVKK